LREINFEKDSVQIGRFRGFDFFGDGSFYVLDTPGHAIGHLAGLARTTSNPDTFIFMGGDLCHHGGEIRPSRHLRIPKEVNIGTPQMALPCPGAVYEDLQIRRNRAPDEPFFEPAIGLDIPETIETIKKAQDADKEDNVWFIYAHDPSLHGIVDLFPKAANDWKEKKWRNETLWTFLQDFEADISR
jgi:glyoxylase-like metal-dependent hydrolase (beta-lactamase superfamily II)